jgi:predicted nucleotidyltransferase component of viral defense system
MISHANLNELVAEWGLRDDVIEKDYVIGWLLWGIGSQPELNKSWAFKGGTCLKKCFLETWRFSEDLDFTVLPEGPIEPEHLQTIFRELLNRIYSASGIDFSVTKPIFKTGGHPNYVEGRIYYRGPRNAPTPARVKLDLLKSEKLVRPAVIKQIVHPYTEYEDSLPDNTGVLCYSFEEVFAEKIRAMGERCRPRDLYDIVNLYRHCNKVEVDPAVIYGILVDKCSTKGVPLTTFLLIDTSPYKQEIISEWANMLGHQLPALPDFEDFWRELPALFNWLETQMPKEILTRMQPDPRHHVAAWAPPPTLAHWGTGFSLESIRFAAFNRLCVDISYVKETGERNQYRIEPYSMYRTQEDYVILRAVNVDTGETRSFRIDRIQSAKAMNTSFVPRFEIEMFEHSA